MRHTIHNVQWFTNLLWCDILWSKVPHTGPCHTWCTHTLCPFSGHEMKRYGSGVWWMISLVIFGYGDSSCTTFIAATRLQTNLGVVRSWLFPASSIKFVTTRSLKSLWAYLAPHEDNRIELLSYVRSIRWKDNFVVSLKLCRFIKYLLAIWWELLMYPMCQLYHSTLWGFMGRLLLSQKFPSASGGSMLVWLHACPFLPKLMQSNLPWSSTLLHPFSLLFVSVQSHGACLFRWAVLSGVNLFYTWPSHQKVLVMKINCP